MSNRFVIGQWEPLYIEWGKLNVFLAPRMVLRVLYKNWKGEIAWRRIIPLPTIPYFSSTPHHTEEQWLIRVWDLDKDAERTYALLDILYTVAGDGPPPTAEETKSKIPVQISLLSN